MKKTILYVLIAVVLIMLAGCPTLFNPFDLPAELIANEGKQFTLDLTEYTDAVNINDVEYKVTSGKGKIEDKKYIWDEPQFNEGTDGKEEVTIEANNNRGRIVSDTFTIIVNRLPSTPTLIEPADGEVVSDNTITLSWNSSDQDVEDEDISDSLSFDVYFGTDKNELSLRFEDVSATTVELTNLATDTYFWDVVAKDRNSEVESDTGPWSFEVSDLVTLNITKTGEGEVSPDVGSHRLSQGAEVELSATPAEGWNFVKWVINGVETADNPKTIIVEEDTTVEAHFTLRDYTLTMLEPEGEGSVTPDIGTHDYNHGDVVELSADPDTGNDFVKWIINEEEVVDNPYDLTMDEDKEVKAVFEVSKFDVSIEIVKGEGEVSPAEGNYVYEYEDVLVLSATAAYGYEFEKWVINDKEYTINPLGWTVKENMQVEVYFVPEEYSLDISKIGDGQVEVIPDKETYDFGDVITLVATPNEADGYKFLKWVINGEEKTDNPATVTIESDTTVEAHFTLKDYTLTMLEPEGEGSVTPEPGDHPFNHGDNATLTATPDYGYHFDKWMIDGVEETESSTILTMKSNVSAKAYFEPNKYELSTEASPTEGGTITVEPDLTLFKYGDSATLTAEPLEGYEFEKWMINEVEETQQSTNVTIAGTATAIAYFEPIKYTLTMTIVEGSGEVEPSEGEHLFNYNEVVALGATADPGYDFEKWVINGNIDEKRITGFNIKEDTNVEAYFTPEEYELAVSVQEGEGDAELIPTKDKYIYGDEVTLVATPNEFNGYEFEKWLINGTEETSPSTKIVVTSNVTIQAYFDLKDIEITITASPADGGETTEGSTHKFGKEVTVVATPNEDYEFISWTDSKDDTVLSTIPTYTFTATEDKHLVANFDKKTYILTIDKIGEGETEPDIGIYGKDKEAPWNETLIATPSGDYLFKGWKLSNEEAFIEATKTDVTVDEDITATAIFKLSEFEITASASPSEGGTVTGDGFYELGSDVTLVATPNENWTFTGWYEYDDLVSTNTSFTFNATGNRDFIAYFKSTILTIESTPLSGIPILVNGKEKVTPYEIDMEATGSIEIEVYQNFEMNLIDEEEFSGFFSSLKDASLTFIDWSDGKISNKRTFSENSDSGTYTINYDVQYLLKTATTKVDVYINKDDENVYFPGEGWFDHEETVTLKVPRDTHRDNYEQTEVKFHHWEVNGESFYVSDIPDYMELKVVFDEPKFILAVYSKCAAD